MRQRVSSSTGRPSSTLRSPPLPTCTSFPCRATVTRNPGSWPESTHWASRRSSRSRRDASKPTSAGSVLIVRLLLTCAPSRNAVRRRTAPWTRIFTHDAVGAITRVRRPPDGGEKAQVEPAYLTGTELAAFLRFEPAVTLTVLAAGMSIDSPVCGLRPVRAERWVRSTVSRPETATLSPRVIASTSSSWRPARTESTVEAGTSARLAMAETSSALFMRFLSCVRWQVPGLGTRPAPSPGGDWPSAHGPDGARPGVLGSRTSGTVPCPPALWPPRGVSEPRRRHVGPIRTTTRRRGPALSVGCMPQLPGTDLTVSDLCLGGNVFGWTADEPTSFAVLDRYV